MASTSNDPSRSTKIIAAVGEAGAVVTKPGDPVEFKGRNAYFADPEQNYWEVVYLESGTAGQGIVDQGEE